MNRSNSQVVYTYEHTQYLGKMFHMLMQNMAKVCNWLGEISWVLCLYISEGSPRNRTNRIDIEIYKDIDVD